MKALLIFDSYFGNTEQIGRAIAKPFESIEIKRSKELAANDLLGYNLLIVGSPTRGFRPTDDISNLINSLQGKALKGVVVATFDTRIALETIQSKFFRRLVNTGGYAAKPLAKRLVQKGATCLIVPEGFYVLDNEGPLKEGELERAEKWGLEIQNSIK